MVAEIREDSSAYLTGAPFSYETRYRQLFDSAIDGIVILDANRLRIVDANPSFSELTGLCHEQLVGQQLSDTVTFNPSINMPLLVADLHRYRTLRRDDLTLFSATGKRILAELVCSLHVEGEQRHLHLNVRDVTERRRHEALLLGQKRVLEMLASGEELRDVLAALAQVIEAQSEGVLGAFLVRQQNNSQFRMAVAPSLPETYVKVMGGAPIGSPYFGPSAMAVDLGESIGTADIATDRRWSREWQQLALEHGLCTCYSSPVLSSTGAILGAFALYQCGLRHAEPPNPQLLETAAHLAGIAIERRQIEKALRESDKRKGEFLALLSHELRNPLAAIRSAVDLLDHRSTANPLPGKVSGILQRQVGQMVRLVDDLLEVGRISRGKVRLHRTRVSLQSVIEQAVESTSTTLRAPDHQLEIELPEADLMVHGDSCRLSQVIGNLLDNACKYTPNGGKIKLVLAQDSHWAVVKVVDSGTGIDKSELNRIFEMFTQLSSDSLQRPNKGLGIGLTLVKSLVEMHGGSVCVHSDGPGCGSEFSLRLPLMTEDSATQPAAGAIPPPAEENANAEDQKHRILVVDDDPDVANSLSMLLNMKGHPTRAVHEPRAAVDAAMAFAPDVVLLDLGMPQMNGYQVAEALRAQLAEHPVLIALTGWGQDQDRSRSQAAGFDGHLVKPVELANLEAMMTHLLSKRTQIPSRP